MELQRRLVEGWIEKKTEEEALLLTLRLEEERQKRLERIDILKQVMKRKWNAKKLREILRMMRQMSLEDLEMEIEEVEARALERMDIDTMEGMDDLEMSGLEPDLVEEGESAKLDSIVVEMDLEPEVGIYKQENSSFKTCSGGLISFLRSSEILLDQTISLWHDAKKCGKKRKSESADNPERKRWRGNWKA